MLNATSTRYLNKDDLNEVERIKIYLSSGFLNIAKNVEKFMNVNVSTLLKYFKLVNKK